MCVCVCVHIVSCSMDVQYMRYVFARVHVRKDSAFKRRLSLCTRALSLNLWMIIDFYKSANHHRALSSLRLRSPRTHARTCYVPSYTSVHTPAHVHACAHARTHYIYTVHIQMNLIRQDYNSHTSMMKSVYISRSHTCVCVLCVLCALCVRACICV